MTPTKPQARFGQIAIVGTLLLISLLAITPNVSADCAAYEDFDSGETVFAPPVTTRCFYTLTQSGTAFVVDTQSVSSPNSVEADNAADLTFTLVSEPICTTAGDTGCNGPSVYSIALRMNQLPDSGENLKFCLASCGANSAGLVINSAGSIELQCNGGAGSSASGTFATLAIDTWYRLNFTINVDVDTDGVGPDTNDVETAGSSIHNAVTNALIGGTGISCTGWTSGANSDDVRIFNVDASTTADYFIDNFRAPLATDLSGIGARFCADPVLGASNDWGYDYKEDVSFESTTPVTISLDDAFLFELPDGDSGYLGKGFSTGSPAFQMNARIEAGSDTLGSIIRLAYTTGTTTLTAGSGGDTGADMTAAGNGQTTGNFAHNIQAVFLETSDHWNIAIKYTDGGSLTQIGSSVNYGQNPNDPATFAFMANSTSTLVAVYAVNNDGSLGNLIISRNLPSGLQTAVWKDAWIIGSGQDAFLDADTAIDDNTDAGDNDDSTCIFDLIGDSVVLGSSGSSPGSTIPDVTSTSTSSTSTSCSSIFCVDSTNTPSGFTTSAFNFFLGLLLMISVAAGIWFLTRSPLMAAIGFAVGYLMGLAFGLLPLWPIVALVIIGAGILFIKSRSTGG